MKHILVTGMAGFVGFHLAKSLKMRGDIVYGIDNFNDYYDPKLKIARVNELSNLKLSVEKADICDKEYLEKLVKDKGIETIVHLAAQAGVRYSLENPGAYVKANVEGFLNVLEVCRNHPHIKLVYASSSSVYGLNTKIPFSIDDRTDRQASLYGATKKSNELFAATYNHLFGIKVTGLRFFTVYGPWGRPDMAYYQFTKDIIENRPIKVFNHGKMKRDFTYIDDIVDGIIASIDLGENNAIFNLGNNQPENLMDMIESIENSLGKKAIKIFEPMQKGDVVETFADIDQSIKKLNFSPKVKLQDGIDRFVKWYLEKN